MTLWILASALTIILMVVDEVILDLLALFWRLGPKPFQENTKSDSPKRLAIIVANWHEDQVLPQMIRANAPLLKDSQVEIFLGVYPNDDATCEVALALSKQYSHVHTVINTRPGPTSKGQMLNEILNFILSSELDNQSPFSGFVMHDSEDLISPQSIHLYRKGLISADFIQVPVISLPRRWNRFVASTYMDEFAECHSKDLLLRQKLGVAIPSAGVGTCLSRKLVTELSKESDGQLFLDNSLTEDYHLGMLAKKKGFSSTFLCEYLPHSKDKQMIATREYFPSSVNASIRQKTRWFTGICLQGWSQLGWFGDFWQRYYLWRDRKALFAAFINLNCFIVLITLSLFQQQQSLSPWLLPLLQINFVLMIFKLMIRMYWTRRHYGNLAMLMVPLRWPLAIYINTIAGFKAIIQYYKAYWLKRELKWAKTSHEFPSLQNIRLITQHNIEKENKEILL